MQNTWEQLACALWRELHALDASQASPAYLNALLSALTRLSFALPNPEIPSCEYMATARTLRSLRLVRELLLDVDLELFPKALDLREPVLVLV